MANYPSPNVLIFFLYWIQERDHPHGERIILSESLLSYRGKREKWVKGTQGRKCPSMLFPSGPLSHEKGPLSSTGKAVCSKSDCLVEQGSILLSPSLHVTVLWGTEARAHSGCYVRKWPSTGTSLILVIGIREESAMGKQISE